MALPIAKLCAGTLVGMLCFICAAAPSWADRRQLSRNPVVHAVAFGAFLVSALSGLLAEGIEVVGPELGLALVPVGALLPVAIETLLLLPSAASADVTVPHSHSHGIPAPALPGPGPASSSTPQSQKGTAGAFALVGALAVHSIAGGVALGSAGSTSRMWVLTTAVAAHKWLEALAVGGSLAAAAPTLPIPPARVAMAYAASTPLGVILGMAISSLPVLGVSQAAGVSCAVSAGTFLYAAFSEALPAAFGAAAAVTRAQRGVRLLAAAAGGVAIGVMLEVAEGGHH